MDPFAYLVPFVSVLVGLAVTDLATSLHRLLRARRRVTWDWLPFATAFLAFISVLDFWWAFYNTQEMASWTLAGFLPLVASLVVLFLLNAAALPDDVPPDGLDLKVFYEKNRSYFWLLFATFVLLATAMFIGRPLVNALSEGTDVLSVLDGGIPNFVLIALYVTLAFVRNRRVHGLAVVAVAVFLLFQWFDRSIGAV